MADGWGVDGGASGGSERRVATLAARQHGVVTRTQLVGLGLSADVIDRRLSTGRLRSLHRGVYMVGPMFPAHATEMAAVLACGPGAVLSHRSAASLWQLLPYPARPTLVDVTAPEADRRPRGIRVHRVRSLGKGETARVKRIPVTTPARTLLDLAADAAPRELEQAVAQAESRNLTNRRKLFSLLARYRGRGGTRALRALLERAARPALTRSEAEERFLALVRSARLPAPDVNVLLGRHEVDFLWREEGLVVEVDGFAFHSSRASFEADRRRDAELAAQGLRVIRVTWRQIADQPEATLVSVAQALVLRGQERGA